MHSIEYFLGSTKLQNVWKTKKNKRVFLISKLTVYLVKVRLTQINRLVNNTV